MNTKAEFTLHVEMDNSYTFMVTCKEHPPFITYGETLQEAFAEAGSALQEMGADRPLLVNAELMASGETKHAEAFAQDNGLR